MDEIVTIEIKKELLQLLVDSDAIKVCDFKIKKVDVNEFDYSNSVLWKTAKLKSDKAYKELKEIEFNIRNNG